MVLKGRMFLAGVVTTFVVLATGFGGGYKLSQTRSELSNIRQRLAPVRVILPSSAEPALPLRENGQTTDTSETPQPGTDVSHVRKAPETPQEISRAERRGAEAEERRRRKKLAERKARREAARFAMQQQQEPPSNRRRPWLPAETTINAADEEGSLETGG
jgi:hypothetical protein